MRFDRNISVCFIGPLQRAGLFPCAAGIPVLMYHSISRDENEGLQGYYKTVTRPERFAEQMAALAAAGWRGVALSEILTYNVLGRWPERVNRPNQWWGCTRGEGGCPVAITFDDGYRDFYEEAWPVLKRHGFRATMFLSSGYVGRSDKRLNGRLCMSWDEARELQAAGIEMGSHTVTHPVLYQMKWDEIEGEVKRAKDDLEAQLGVGVATFAYPYAFPYTDRDYTRRLEDLLIGIGHRCCATTRVGRVGKGRPDFFIDRLPVNEGDDGEFLLAKMNGAYDWIGWPQSLFKQVFRRKRSQSMAEGGEIRVRAVG